MAVGDARTVAEVDQLRVQLSERHHTMLAVDRAVALNAPAVALS